MKELRTGFIPDAEMAEWCDKSLDTFKKNRKRWSETKLVRYADFELKRGGIEILKVKDPVYNQSGFKEVQNKWRPYWGYNGLSIDSSKACWNKLKPNLTTELSDRTGQVYISKIKCEDYGVPFKKNKREGKKGHCNYVFCKIVNGIPEPFTEEEEKIKKELENKYLKTWKQCTYDIQALAAALKQNEISEEEYFEMLNVVIETKYGWEQFQTALEEAIGYPTDFRQELIDDVIKQMNENESFDF